MSVKDFKFVSPGVFIHEIDNSFVPKSADVIGPVIIGRAQRGISMVPVKVQSYSEFVEVFGDTVPGDVGGDVYRDSAALQSPMYGTYAAKAFLRSNVAPLTYVRLLGHQAATPTADAGSKAGWKTDNFIGSTGTGGGALGLWVAKSGNVNTSNPAWSFTGSNAMQLAAIWYSDNGGAGLVGAGFGSGSDGTTVDTDANGETAGLVVSDDNGVFTMQISGATAATREKITFSLNDNSEDYVRKKFNTNPQLRVAGDFYSSEKDWWLGETFDQEIRDADLASGKLVGCLLGVQLQGGSDDEGPANMYGQAAREAIAGWFVGQDIGDPTDFKIDNVQKLFRLHGRGHGEWLAKNAKVSIEDIRPSNSTVDPYGTFSVVIRALSDTDNRVQVMERFDNLNLNPNSPNYIGVQIGTDYYSWNEDERELVLEGDGHANRSKFIRVEVSSEVRGNAVGIASLVPFGYFGPPKLQDATLNIHQTGSDTLIGDTNKYIIAGPDLPGRATGTSLSSSGGTISASFAFPITRLRTSASDGGVVNYRDAYFGFQTTRATSSNVGMPGMHEPQRLWTQAMAVADPSSGTITGVDNYAYIFTLDNVRTGSSTTGFYYESGSHAAGRSVTGHTASATSYKTLLDLGINKFTAPFWGASDGLNIRVPDPMYNNGMDETSTNDNNSIYYTWRRAIDSIADPEFVDMNLLAAPGLGLNGLTGHMINVCENRADALALIDLEDAYVPRAEGSLSSYSTRSDRVTYTATQLANNLKDRRIDSSYGATFYPWVQTRDEASGQLVWVPPTVAMLGVLASSERKSKIWFAPAGFNRGGLSDGAAGIPITQVTTRLSSRDRDTLYNARINPIASFPSTGIVVFGQKTLQERQSALDRINVRRLVIYLKKQISILSTQILFEQNVQATWNRFKGLIDPFLANVTTEYGITDYRLILDESTTTADLIDQNIMYAKIMIKPARAIEFIAIDFVIASTGASFDD
jgi:hypothetical protein